MQREGAREWGKFQSGTSHSTGAAVSHHQNPELIGSVCVCVQVCVRRKWEGGRGEGRGGEGRKQGEEKRGEEGKCLVSERGRGKYTL